MRDTTEKTGKRRRSSIKVWDIPGVSKKSKTGSRKILFISVMRNLIPLRGPLLSQLVKAGHQVTVCGQKGSPEIVRQLEKMGVRFVPVFLKQHGMNPAMDFVTLLNMVWVIRKIAPDIVFSAVIKTVIYGSLAARLAGVSNVYAMISGSGYAFMRTTFKARVINILVRSLYHMSLPKNRIVYFQNPDDFSLFVDLKLVKKKQAVLINGSGVDLSHHRPAPPVKNGPVFLLICRLIKDKGVVQYAEAARIIKRRHPEAVFNLVGPLDGNNPSAVPKAQIDQWHQEGVINYCGETDDVRPFIADASVFVLPSYYREGTPHSTLEAMAMERPIITTDAPGCRETVIEGKNGFLIPVKDVDALVEAMERFIVNPELIEEMGRASRKYAAEKFDVKKVNSLIFRKMGL